MPSATAFTLRRAGIVTIAVGAIVTLIGTVTVGSKGLIGGLLGTVLVVVFFAVGQVVVGWAIANVPEMGLTIALATYLVKVGLLFGLLIALNGTTAFNTKVFAIAIVACTIAWTVTEVLVYSRTKVLYVEPGGQP